MLNLSIFGFRPNKKFSHPLWRKPNKFWLFHFIESIHEHYIVVSCNTLLYLMTLLMEATLAQFVRSGNFHKSVAYNKIRPGINILDTINKLARCIHASRSQ